MCFPWCVFWLLATHPSTCWINKGVGRCGCGWGCVCETLSCLFSSKDGVRFQSTVVDWGGGRNKICNSSLWSGGLLQTWKWFQNNIMFQCISKYYVMLEFNLHSSVLNFHCEGLFAHWCFQFITLLLQNVALKVADPVNVRKGRGKPTWQDVELIYELMEGCLCLLLNVIHFMPPASLSHCFPLIFNFFLFYIPFTFSNSYLSLSSDFTSSPSSLYASFIYNPSSPTFSSYSLNLRILSHSFSRTHSQLAPLTYYLWFTPFPFFVHKSAPYF